MNPDALLEDESLPAAMVLRVDKVCDRFEQAWRSGPPPELEQFLADTPEPEQTLLFRELLAIELAYSNTGECLDVYLQRFPNRLELLREMFAHVRASTQAARSAETAKPGAGATLPGGPPEKDGGLPLIPGYDVLGKLGQGGMGVVYRARQQSLNREVALKVTAHGQPLARFRREAETVARLEHANIVHVYDFGEAGGVLYLSMELVHGGSLDQHVNEYPLPAPEDPAFNERRRKLVVLMETLARTVQFIHDHQIVHRDLKPANILLTPDGNPKISDFGLLKRTEDDQKLTKSATVVGTIAYMAPEQAEGRAKIGPAADIYALGAILYELLTGRPAFRGETWLQTLDQVRNQAPVPPSLVRTGVPGDLEAICLRCLQKDPEQRYFSAGVLADELRSLLDGSASKELVVSARRTAASRGRRRLAGILAGAALALAGLAMIGYFALGKSGQSSVLSSLPDSGVGVSAAEPLKGWLDVRIWETGNERRRNVRLSDPGALPLKARDTIRIEAELNRAAYVYVLWIDSAGKVAPVYPWKPGDWAGRPQREQAAARLSLPEAADQGWPMQPGPAGMETLLLFARETPLPRDLDLQKLLTGLPPQKSQDGRSAVWFENGVVARSEQERAPNFFNVQQLDDPIVQTQRLLRQSLQAHFSYTRAVSFANQGN